MDTSALDKYIGQPVEVEDSTALDQCMDLAFLWCDLIGIPRSAIRNGYAYQVWGNHDPNYLEVVSGAPQPGDFAIWGTQVGFAGHIAVVKSGNFTSYDQNWNYIQKVEVVPHTYYGVLGFLRPKNHNQGEEQMIIGDGDNWFNRCDKTMYQIRGRHMSREEFAPQVGRDFLHFVEDVSDNPEADAATHAQEVGQEAIKANWNGQIDKLTALAEDRLHQITDLTDKNVQLNVLNQSLKTQVAQYQGQPVQPSTPITPAPQPSVSPTPSDNSITITKDGLWAKIKAFLGIK